MNLTELLDKTAGDWPKKMALIEGDNAVSYADLVELTVVLASAIAGAAVAAPHAGSDFVSPTASTMSR
jgi:non-ribosomal peptide synthetase component E (peptide arylation enzyme)